MPDAVRVAPAGPRNYSDTPTPMNSSAEQGGADDGRQELVLYQDGEQGAAATAIAIAGDRSGAMPAAAAVAAASQPR